MCLYYDEAELKEVKLVEEDGSYFLDVTYEYENKHGVYKLNVPKIHLPIVTNMLPTYSSYMSRDYFITPQESTIDLGFGDLYMLKDFETGMTHKITQVKKKPRKMTVAEIEAALGYSVEIVSE